MRLVRIYKGPVSPLSHFSLHPHFPFSFTNGHKRKKQTKQAFFAEYDPPPPLVVIFSLSNTLDPLPDADVASSQFEFGIDGDNQKSDARTAPLTAVAPFSAFRTPYLNSSHWAGVEGMGHGPDRFFRYYGDDKLSVRTEQTNADENAPSGDPFPAWAPNDQVPVSRNKIGSIINNLKKVFGFQEDNAKNIYQYLMRMLDSRASRMAPEKALRTLHGDYIGGPNANFRKWYFASQMDIDDAHGWANVKINGIIHKTKETVTPYEKAVEQWYKNMLRFSNIDYVTQVALYLLCWGEANNVRFMPECLCFIFKCCNDYYYSLDDYNESEAEVPFLDHIITPLYKTYFGYSYEAKGNRVTRCDRDHSATIGYDDMNQLFWHRKGIERITLSDLTPLMYVNREARYNLLGDIDWSSVFCKTYFESRTWLHVLTNFNRVLLIHFSVFWYYTSFNSKPLYTYNYSITREVQPPPQTTLTVMALAGTWACLISLISILLEMMFMPRKWPIARPAGRRIICLFLLLLVNTAPTVALFFLGKLEKKDTVATIIAAVQFTFSIGVVAYLVFKTHANQFGAKPTGRKGLASEVFTSSFYKLKDSDKLASYGLWVCVFACKFVESYLYLTLSLKDPLRELFIMKVNRCVGDQWIGSWLCNAQPRIILVLIVVLDFVLFFLDTYLWYVIWNTFISVLRSFYIGASIWTPWRNIFSRLPKRIESKLLVTTTNNKFNQKMQVSKVWNSIIIAMYREHFLSIEQVHRLLYEIAYSSDDDEMSYVVREPTFFVSQEDDSLRSSLFQDKSEARRRITFFAQSLSTPMPDIREVSAMPSFTVLIPHYTEKIILLLKEIIREEDRYSHVTMLEYLKQLHASEWANFVWDTKQMAEEEESQETLKEVSPSEKFDDLPYYSVGFKTATPEYVTRTRIWASLRSQTLYRTVSGFMNYTRALKLLSDLEISKDHTSNTTDEVKLRYINDMAARKFRIIASMQRYKKFTEEERENTEYLMRAYPELQIAYIDEECDDETGLITYYLALVDGTCPVLEQGDRIPKYRIRLSGNPILGDGKSDNQNHALIFSRGEYIQLIDANQDNYIEECLKVRSTLAEFEEHRLPDPYKAQSRQSISPNPVAIVGLREYIFSENIGILGDVAAGKEQTFGTLFARTLSQIGGKLHYGHPDFLNAIFMSTRGGVSKSQKGLHLNEDIYAGMNVVLRGGRIKHCEYIQCGKGRDLGFSSILNFITKIGAGMGEQLLSREYFYLGTQLPLDRFLSFYYAHAGFHLNNVFIVLSIQLFLLVGINIAALANDSSICEYDKHIPITDPRRPNNCLNLVPVIRWLERCIYSIFVVFIISFIPLGVQEVTERGIYKCFARLGKHFISLSPLFEVFVCKMYAKSIMGDIAVGGAQYFATGRGFETRRESFSSLFARFANEALNSGAFSLLLVVYISVSWWKISFIYFWMTIFGLLICPFLFNPNQFSRAEFFLDYGQYLKWLFGGNSSAKEESWIKHTKIGRIKFTGLKSKLKYGDEDVKVTCEVKPKRLNIIILSVLPELFSLVFVGCAYLFTNSQAEARNALPSLTVFRILFVSLAPLAVNIAILIVSFVISIFLGPPITFFFKGFPGLISGLSHILALVNQMFFVELLWVLQNLDIPRTLLGIACMVLIQRIVLRLLNAMMLTREFRHGKSNQAWWSGKWVTADLGWLTFTQPLREFICKISELTYFTLDVVVGHTIFYMQLPILICPFADTWHSFMLLWVKPGSQMRRQLLSKKQRSKQRITVFWTALLFLVVLLLFVGLVVAPIIVDKVFRIDIGDMLPEIMQKIRQPKIYRFGRKGFKNH